MTGVVHHADVLDWLRGNQWLVQNGHMERAHAVFADPPYFLGSIAKRFGGANAKPAKFGRDGAFQRQSRGFMGATWDGFSDVWAYQAWVTEWATLLLDFVYPGALLAMFGGTRTYHRLAAGLEDAGWEVFDCMMYVYGSGFPKAADIGKLIEKSRKDDVRPVCRYLHSAIEASGKTQKQVAEHFGFHVRMVNHWAANDTDSQPTVPTIEQWYQLQQFIGFSGEMDSEVERLNERKGEYGDDWYTREVIGEVTKARAVGSHSALPTLGAATEYQTWDITAPATDAAKKWDGFKSALKPAYEPIILARAPRGNATYAELAQTWGTGALNVDGGRIGTNSTPRKDPRNGNLTNAHMEMRPWMIQRIEDGLPLKGDFDGDQGRYPANLILGCACEGAEHDEDCAVRLLDAQSGVLTSGGLNRGLPAGGSFAGLAHRLPGERTPAVMGHDDSGGASRFYFCAKAPSWQREAGLHNTGEQTWASRDQNQNTRQVWVTRLRRAITGWSSGIAILNPHALSLHMIGCGNKQTGRSRKGIRFITRTSTSKTIVLRTSNFSIHSRINASTADVNSEMVSGSNPVVSVGNSKPSMMRIGIYHVSAGCSTDVVSRATSQKSSATSVNGNKHGARKVNDGRKTPIDNPYQRGEKLRLNSHPTIKPITLCEYIARLLLPPVLDVPRRILVPFAGVSSEMIGARLAGWDEVIGIEMTAEYIPIGAARLAWWAQFASYEAAEAAYKKTLAAVADAVAAEQAGQLSLWGAA